LIEIRFHGLGGHGAVVASKFLADAAARNGYQAQAFASYGALRRGGKVESYVRISKNLVRPHCKLYEPDWLVLMDDGLAEDPAALSGLKNSGSILINSGKAPAEFPALDRFRVYTVNAYRIAKKKGLVLPGGMPVINTTLLGALAALLNPIPLKDLKTVIHEKTPKPEVNMACADEGYRQAVSASRNGDLKKNGQTVPPSVPSTAKPYPVYDPQKMPRCNRCQICFMVCPSLAIGFATDPFSLFVNESVCTGCGICIEECPRKAISWGEDILKEGKTGHD
jgi:pyruvate ferredoxin oxidoreductase gamma subunit